jgi:hypothetical protein
MKGRVVNNELEGIWKEADMACSRYYINIFWEGLIKTRKPSVPIAGVAAESRTEHHPNVSIER